LSAKFQELAGTVLTPQGAAAVEQAIGDCEQWENVGVLTSLCRRHGET